MLGLAGASLFIYGRSLTSPLVGDDWVLIEHSAGGLGSALSWIGNYHYNPVVHVLLWVLYTFFGVNPIAYHATALLFFWLGAVGIMYAAWRLSSQFAVGLLAAVLFIAHGRQYEAVIWGAVSIFQTVGLVLFLVGFIAYLRYLDSPLDHHSRRWAYGLFVAAVVLSPFAYEPEVVLAVVCMLYRLLVIEHNRGFGLSELRQRARDWMRDFAAPAVFLSPGAPLRHLLLGPSWGNGHQRRRGRRQAGIPLAVKIGLSMLPTKQPDRMEPDPAASPHQSERRGATSGLPRWIRETALVSRARAHAGTRWLLRAISPFGRDISARQRPWSLGRLLDRYHWVVALLLYTAATLAITYPLIWHLSDWIVGPNAGGDAAWQPWNLWWYRRALSTGQDPAYTHLIFALTPQVHMFGLQYTNWVIGGILQFVTSPLATYNLVVLIGFAFSGLTMYLLASEFTSSRLACFVAGFLYDFSTYHFLRSFGHLDLATLQWLPLCAWRVFVFYRRPSLGNALWMGLTIALVPLSDFYLSAYFLVPFALLFVAGLLWKNRTWMTTPRNLALTGLALALALAVAIIPLWSSLRVDPSEQVALSQYAAAGISVYSGDLLAYFVPHALNPLVSGNLVLSSVISPMYAHMSGNLIEQSNYLGWVTISLGLATFLFAARRTRANLFWLGLSIFALLLSLGTRLRVAGYTIMPLPFYKVVFGLVPVLANFRAPNRLGAVVLLGMAVLAAQGFTEIADVVASAARRLPARLHTTREIVLPAGMVAGAVRALPVVLAGLVLVASLAENIQGGFPLPSTPIQTPSFYSQVAANHDDGLLLDLPLYPRGLDHYYQIIHQKPLVGGYPLRMTTDMMLSLENVPYLSYFDLYPELYRTEVAWSPSTTPDDVRLGDIYPVPATFRQALQEFNIRHVVLHHDFPSTYPWMRAYLISELGTPDYDSDTFGLTAWHIDPPTAPQPARYRFALGTGWSGGIIVQPDHQHVERDMQQDAQILIDAPQSGVQHLSVTAFAATNATVMEVTLNGEPLSQVAFDQGSPKTVDLGAITLRQGRNVMQFHSQAGCTNGNPNCVTFGVTKFALTESGSAG